MKLKMFVVIKKSNNFKFMEIKNSEICIFISLICIRLLYRNNVDFPSFIFLIARILIYHRSPSCFINIHLQELWTTTIGHLVVFNIFTAM